MIATFAMSEELVKRIMREHVCKNHGFDEEYFKIEVEIDHAENIWRVQVSEK